MAFPFTAFEDTVDCCIFPIDSKITGFRCVWTIHDYMEVKKQTNFGWFLEVNPELNLSFEKKCLKYHFELFPHGYYTERETEVSFGYNKVVSRDIKETSVLKLSLLLNSERRQPIISKVIVDEANERYGSDEEWWGFVDRNFLVNGSLIILLEGSVSFYNDVTIADIFTPHRDYDRQTKLHEDMLQEKLENLHVALKQLKSQSKYSDVCFSVDDEQFELHKNVLSSKSEVFDKMFSDKKELNIIQLQDMTPEVFRELVHFIYTNSVTRNFHEMVLELMKAADLYKISQLKKLCEKYLVSNINVENVAKSILVAFNHSAGNLMKKCSEFIRENWHGIQETDGWGEVRSNPDLMFYLLNGSLSLQK